MLGQGQRCLPLAALACAAWLLAPACKARPKASDQRPALGPIHIKPVPSVEVLGRALSIDEQALRAKLAAQLTQSGIFDQTRSPHATATVTVEAMPFAEGSIEAIEIGIKLRLRISVRPEGKVPARFAEDVAAVGQAPLVGKTPEAAEQALQRLAERTVDDVVRGYLDRQRLWLGDDSLVAAALSSPDTDLKVEALRVVGSRRMRALAPTVVALLTHDDEGVRDAALGTVLALRDRSAVKVLASSRQMRDTREMRKVVHAMAVLGGAEVREYLAFVAETHDDEEIRGLAKEALERLAPPSRMGQPTK